MIVCICYASKMDSYLVSAEEMVLGRDASQELRQ